MLDSDRVNRILASLIPDERGCCIWPGRPRHHGGYATSWIDGRERRLNRYVLEKKLGRPIAEGMLALHECDVRMCVAVEHIYEGTHEKNMEDMVARNRAAVGDRNGARLYPEKWKRGDEHYTRTKPELAAHGSRHGRSKLTESDIPEIRRLAATTNMTHAEIAELYGVGQVTVSAVVRRASWKHMP